MERIQVLVNQLRDLIAKASHLEKDHQVRLLKRLEKLQAEICLFHRTWTVIPQTLGRLFHVHLDIIGAQRRGVDIVSDPF
jgi:hypothetical protein